MQKPGMLLLAGLLAFAACNRGPRLETETAVREAIERYLSSRPNLNMQGMDLQVSGIKFRPGEAEADVTFRAKNDSQAAMTIRYSLRRQGDRWEVEPQSTGHAGMTPPADGSGELPPGHPPAGSSSPQPPQGSELPPGHPPVRKQ